MPLSKLNKQTFLFGILAMNTTITYSSPRQFGGENSKYFFGGADNVGWIRTIPERGTVKEFFQNRRLLIKLIYKLFSLSRVDLGGKTSLTWSDFLTASDLDFFVFCFYYFIAASFGTLFLTETVLQLLMVDCFVFHSYGDRSSTFRIWHQTNWFYYFRGDEYVYL